MKKTIGVVVAGIAVGTLLFSGVAFARGNGNGYGGGDQLRLRDGSCVTFTQSRLQDRVQDRNPIHLRLRDGSCLS